MQSRGVVSASNAFAAPHRSVIDRETATMLERLAPASGMVAAVNGSGVREVARTGPSGVQGRLSDQLAPRRAATPYAVVYIATVILTFPIGMLAARQLEREAPLRARAPHEVVVSASPLASTRTPARIDASPAVSDVPKTARPLPRRSRARAAGEAPENNEDVSGRDLLNEGL